MAVTPAQLSMLLEATALLEPLADAVGRHVLEGKSLFADDTPVKLLAPGTGKTATGGPGPMCGTSGPGRAKRRRRRGTASRATARRRTVKPDRSVDISER